MEWPKTFNELTGIKNPTIIMVVTNKQNYNRWLFELQQQLFLALYLDSRVVGSEVRLHCSWNQLTVQ